MGQLIGPSVLFCYRLHCRMFLFIFRFYFDSTVNMLSYCETIQLAEKNISKQPDNASKSVREPRISPPPLIPAPHLSKKMKASHQNVALPPLSQSISWANLYHQQREEMEAMKQSLADSSCEIECLKSTIEAANEIISFSEDNVKQLQKQLSLADAKCDNLKLELAQSKSTDEKQQNELKRLQILLAEFEKSHQLQSDEINSLKAKTDRLCENSVGRIVAHPKKSVQAIHPPDEVDETSRKKRQKMNHHCSNCGYSTVKAYHMKIHREEGCQSAVVTKNLSCCVCGAKFTYNRLRYHLNQYTKQSSHAQNGHQNYTTQQHRDMLKKLKESK